MSPKNLLLEEFFDGYKNNDQWYDDNKPNWPNHMGYCDRTWVTATDVNIYNCHSLQSNQYKVVQILENPIDLNLNYLRTIEDPDKLTYINSFYWKDSVVKKLLTL